MDLQRPEADPGREAPETVLRGNPEMLKGLMSLKQKVRRFLRWVLFRVCLGFRFSFKVSWRMLV